MILWLSVLRPLEPHSLTRLNFAARLKLLDPPQDELFQLGELDPKLNFHAGRTPIRINDLSQLPKDPSKTAILIASESQVGTQMPSGWVLVGQEVVAEGKDPLILLSRSESQSLVPQRH
jgi:hypothetical protein